MLMFANSNFFQNLLLVLEQRPGQPKSNVFPSLTPERNSDSLPSAQFAESLPLGQGALHEFAGVSPLQAPRRSPGQGVFA